MGDDVVVIAFMSEALVRLGDSAKILIMIVLLYVRR